MKTRWTFHSISLPVIFKVDKGERAYIKSEIAEVNTVAFYSGSKKISRHSSTNNWPGTVLRMNNMAYILGLGLRTADFRHLNLQIGTEFRYELFGIGIETPIQRQFYSIGMSELVFRRTRRATSPDS